MAPTVRWRRVAAGVYSSSAGLVRYAPTERIWNLFAPDAAGVDGPDAAFRTLRDAKQAAVRRSPRPSNRSHVTRHPETGERVVHGTKAGHPCEYIAPGPYHPDTVDDPTFRCEACLRLCCWCFGTAETDIDRCCDCWARGRRKPGARERARLTSRLLVVARVAGGDR